MIKALLTPIFMILHPVLVGFLAYLMIVHGSLAAIIAYLCALPALIWINAQMFLKFPDNLKYYPVFTAIHVASIAFAGIEFFRTEDTVAMHVINLSVNALIGYLLFVYWIARLPRRGENKVLRQGERLPDIVLEDVNGSPITSVDLVGTPNLFMFIRGNWCPLCMAQVKSVAKGYEEIQDLGVRVVLITPQNPDDTRKLAEKHKVDFLYLVDKDLKTADTLGLRHKNGVPISAVGYGRDTVLPTLVFTNEEGRIQYVNSTDNARVRPVPADFIKIVKQLRLQNFLEGKVQARTAELKVAQQKADDMLSNILPSYAITELKELGKTIPRLYQDVPVFFSDFVGFTKLTRTLTPEKLVHELDEYYREFDRIVGKHELEKIKTIGDAYMFAGSIPKKDADALSRAVRAALEIQEYVKSVVKTKGYHFQCRAGIHIGDVVAGVVGEKKFAYDIWGDTVNVASRLESAGAAGRVNVSGAVYEKLQGSFDFEKREEIDVKSLGKIQMYFVQATA